jgi:hypothetical protein
MPFFSPFGGSSNPNGGSSYGASNVASVGAGVSDLFNAQGANAKKGSDLAEQREDQDAATLAFQNEKFTVASTQIKEAQQNREITQALGKTTADVAGAGFAQSGSALDILRSGAQQGAITQAVASQQGLITEAGYQEQGDSLLQMANAAGEAAKAESSAMTGDYIAAGISAVAALVPK